MRISQVNPATPGYITLDDLIRCGVGHTVVAMIIDVKGFYSYDNREALIFSQRANAEEELLEEFLQ